MDVKLQWKLSDDVESLVASIVDCKNQLTSASNEKHGTTNVKLLSCDAYAGEKLVTLLRLSELWQPAIEFTEEDLLVPLSRRQKKTTELQADFQAFKLHCMPILGETVLRVVNVFHVDGTSSEQTMYGNVEILQ